MEMMRIPALSVRHYCAGATDFYDIVIIGGGIVGSAMACSLGKGPLSSKRVLLLDSSELLAKNLQKEANEFNNRVSAIRPSSVKFFEKLGIWETLKIRSKAVSTLYVEDGCSGSKISFEQFKSESPLAYIIENDRIIQSLHENIKKQCPNILWQQATFKEMSVPEDLGENVRVELDSGKNVECSLLIAADGANSKVREISGIEYTREDYGQTSIVATLELSREIEQNTIAWQRFLPNGPIALLPLNERLSSLVWTTATSEAQRLMGISTASFVDELNRELFNSDYCNPKMTAPLDTFTTLLNKMPFWNSPKSNFPSILSLPLNDRACFPLSYVYATDYIAPRVALIGDAAHRVHPLAGQGVNLGWSDVDCLTRTLERAKREGGDIGSLAYLKDYDNESQRRNVPIMSVIDNLNKLFSTDAQFPVFIRSFGFTFMDRLLPVKDLIIRMAS